MKTDQTNVEQYQWGEGCLGWRLVNRIELSVLRERMPPGTKEVRHYHRKSRQFFFILQGSARIELNGEEFVLSKDDGLEVPPEAAHQIFNDGPADLEFLLVSHPATAGDRVEI